MPRPISLRPRNKPIRTVITMVWLRIPPSGPPWRQSPPFQGQQMVAALGSDEYGRKMILGIRQGATENATVVGELLGDLVDRGLDFNEPRLYILDGGKALTAAVKKHADVR